MGTCKYCGKDAGLFSHGHKECEEKHEQGILSVEDGIRRYFKDFLKKNELTGLVTKLKSENCVTDPDIAISSAKCIDEYTEKSRWPFHSHQLDLVKDYLCVIGVPYKSINVNGSLDNLSQKMVRGFLAEYFTGQRNMEPAWTKTCGRKFALTSRIIEQPNGGTREVPCYQLTKTECLYIATKFNDEARAKLVLRWEELERANALNEKLEMRNEK